ncbi:pollen receptor-like kinase 4 [Vitis riparia]|uniref:pollen receptor-like kinase 4 n=1 Tax=Vitis riparia TaxID=96939 RepID=UPI00155AFC1F|nr:pollen receptor-like kinase 4 [Vitis riparia]
MGAHAALLVRAPTPSPLPIALVLILVSITSSEAVSDADILLKFRVSLGNATVLGNWNTSRSVCSTDQTESWKGVRCWNGSVWGLRLESLGLNGAIDLDSLSSLRYLRTISFMNNSFEGPLPEIKKLVALKSVYLSNNHFSGDIPDDAFSGMAYLKKVHLANNKFTGKIPSSLATLPRLLVLRLDGNKFEGQIPDFQQKHLANVNISNNMLGGPIPASLSRISSSSFSGNKDLCGKPLDSCSSKKPSAVIVALIVVAIALILVTIGLLLLVLHRNIRTVQLGGAAPVDNHSMSEAAHSSLVECGTSEMSGHSKRSEQGKLTFVRDDRERFDLQDLLRASAEVLGSGNFGSSYKAVLLSGEAMVAKRYKQMNNVGREEFQEHMRRLGRLAHPNLLPLVAYYYRKEEKLLVSEYVENGSLASHLHGNHSIDQPGLNWQTRLRIIKGVAKGLAYLYNELPSLIVAHGHLKSSNVLLDESFNPVLTDYALLPVINPEHARQLMVAYKSPEFAQHSRTTKKTDVWGLGILILEILTGKFPTNYLTVGNNSEEGITWVNSIANQEWMMEVFDKEMGGTENSKGEMLKLLKIGLACCEEDVERRWDLKEAIKHIEELEVTDGTNEEGDEFPSIAMTEDMSTITL